MKRSFFLFLLPILLACAKNAPAPIATVPPPTSVPYTIVLDFGHGGFDGGATGVETGVVEAELNLAVGLAVRDALSKAGCQVILTRADERALGKTKREDMHARGEILKNPDAACTVSIHMNKFRDRSVSGPMAFYQAGAEQGQLLAQSVIDALTQALERPSRAANPADNFVTRVPTVPSVLVECGFLSNRDDEKNLQDPAYRQKLADAIADGVMQYLALRAEPTPTPLQSTEPLLTD